MKTSADLFSLCVLTSCALFGAALGGCAEQPEFAESEAFLVGETGSELELELDEGAPELPEPEASALELAGPEGEAPQTHSAQCPAVGYWHSGPAPTPWFDLANCYVAPLPSLPAGVHAFVWANNWYVTPGPGNSCAVGTFDLANCYIGSAPAGSEAFIYAGNLYFTPVPVEGIPDTRRPLCVQPWGPGALANCEIEAQLNVDEYTSGNWDTATYIGRWSGDPCPAGTSIVPGSQFYVPGSCWISPGNECGPELRHARYRIGVMCE